mmetsp:Transcript_2849/g.7468  ORF Transcript_2849/g.7468 Transcript_2849/m.7468 type:complete len:220 (+) Transcript_2849:1201-1860(+)
MTARVNYISRQSDHYIYYHDYGCQPSPGIAAHPQEQGLLLTFSAACSRRSPPRRAWSSRRQRSPSGSQMRQRCPWPQRTLVKMMRRRHCGCPQRHASLRVGPSPPRQRRHQPLCSPPQPSMQCVAQHASRASWRQLPPSGHRSHAQGWHAYLRCGAPTRHRAPAYHPIHRLLQPRTPMLPPHAQGWHRPVGAPHAATARDHPRCTKGGATFEPRTAGTS